MVTAIIVRCIGDIPYTRILELPVVPHAGDRVTLPGVPRPLPVTRVVLHTRDPKDWTLGVVGPRVEVELAREHDDAVAEAVERGWAAATTMTTPARAVTSTTVRNLHKLVLGLAAMRGAPRSERAPTAEQLAAAVLRARIGGVLRTTTTALPHAWRSPESTVTMPPAQEAGDEEGTCYWRGDRLVPRCLGKYRADRAVAGVEQPVTDMANSD